MNTIKWKAGKFAIKYQQTGTISKISNVIDGIIKKHSLQNMHHVLIIKRYSNPSLLEIPVRVKYVYDGKFYKKRINGIIDTGCSRTSISMNVAAEIGLKIINYEPAFGSTAKSELMPVYQSCGMIIDKSFEIAPSIIGSIYESSNKIQMLIGMDILKCCKFSLTKIGNTNIMIIKADY